MGSFSDWEDPLEKEIPEWEITHSGILAWEIPWGAWETKIHGVARVDVI